MEISARVFWILGIFLLIEGVDYYVDSFNSPWWLSLIMAIFLPLSDIILMFVIDVLTDN